MNWQHKLMHIPSGIDLTQHQHQSASFYSQPGKLLKPRRYEHVYTTLGAVIEHSITDQSTELFIGAHSILEGAWSYADYGFPSIRTGSGALTYQQQGSLFRLPKVVKIVWSGGWFGSEANDLMIFTHPVGSDYDHYTQVAPGTTGDLEPPGTGGVDYYNELVPALNTALNAAGISVVNKFHYGSELGTFSDDHNYGAAFPDLTDPQKRYNHPGRWLLSVAGRYSPDGGVGSSNEDIPNVAPFDWKEQSPPNQIIGGSVYTIVFVSDGLHIYHGYTNAAGTLADPASTWLDEDKQRIIDQYDRYQKFGCLVVSSPKHPEFYPCCYVSDSTNTLGDGRTLCYPEARAHLTSVVTDLSAYGFDLMMRDVTIGAPSPGGFHDGLHTNHVEWNGAAPSIAAIVQKAKDFFGVA